MPEAASPCSEVAVSRPAKEHWLSPSVSYLGKVRDLVQGGGGKLSAIGGDPGDGRKQSGGGG